jgi:hypothetical protein
MTFEETYLENYQSIDCPLFIFRNETIVIYPMPTETVNDGIEWRGQIKLFDINATTLEKDILAV